MESQNKFNKTSIGKILAVTASIASLFSLILFFAHSLETSSDIGKAMIPIQLCCVALGTVIFTVYYLKFYSSGLYPVLVPVSIISIGIGILISPLQSLIELKDGGDIWPTLGAMVIPTIIAMLLFFATYFIYKGNNGKYFAFLALPIGYYVINAIALGGSFGSYSSLCTCSLLCIIISFFVFGLDLNGDTESAEPEKTNSISYYSADEISRIEEKIQLAYDSYTKGIITDEEFYELRQRILSDL